MTVQVWRLWRGRPTTTPVLTAEDLTRGPTQCVWMVWAAAHARGIRRAGRRPAVAHGVILGRPTSAPPDRGVYDLLGVVHEEGT